MFGFNPLYIAVLGLMGGPVPTFSLNFLGNTLNPVVTFSRASNASQFDAQGRLVWAPAQWLTRGNDFASVWTGGADTTATANYGTAPSGRPSTLVTWVTPTPSAGQALASQPCIVGAPVKYQVKLRYVNHAWVRITVYSQANANNNLRLWVNLQTRTLGTVLPGGTATLSASSFVDLGGGWVQVTVAGLLPFTLSNDMSVLVATALADGDVTRVGSGAALEMAEAVVCPYNGFENLADNLFTSAEFATAGSAYYGPRLDYNPATLAARGLLIEEARTNLVSTSNAASVSVGVGTVSANAVGPSGVPNDAFTLTEGVIAGNHVANSNSATFTAAVHTVSAFVKAGTATRCQLFVSSAVSAEYANFSLVGAGSVLVQNGSNNARIVQCASGWYRISIGFTALAASGSVFVGHINSDAATRLPSYTGTGLTLQCSEFQAELGAFSTSLIKTFGTTATRAVETAFSDSITWYNQLGGTFVCTAETVNNATTRTFFNLSNGTGTAERLQLRQMNTNAFVSIFSVAGVVQAGGPTSLAATPGVIRTSFQAAVGNRQISVNGAAVVTGTTAAMPAVTRLNYGVLVTTGTENINGWVREFRYFDKRDFTTSDLQTLSAL